LAGSYKVKVEAEAEAYKHGAWYLLVREGIARQSENVQSF